jgi:hypothetical protein
MALLNPPLPKLTDGYLGKQIKFDDYGLTTISHPDPVIYLSEDNPQVSLELTQSSTCLVLIYFILFYFILLYFVYVCYR